MIVRRVTSLLRYAALTAELGRRSPTPWDALRAVRVAALLWPLRALRRRRAPLQVSVRSAGERVDLLVGQADDLGTVREVFLQHTYRAPLGSEPRTVVDLGANTGVATRYFRARHPDATILAVEPDPRALEVLRANVEDLDDVTVVPAAVAGQHQERARLRLGRQTIASTLLPDGGDAGGDGSVAVTALTLDELLDAHGIEDVDLLKIDIEGAEYEALRAFQGLDRVGAIVGEFHEREDGPTADAFFGLLGRFDLTTHREGRHLTFTGVAPTAS